tara:strand:+ start:226 stop:543 length:318 start_codon:yes stop_codon:yes gene_type:complete
MFENLKEKDIITIKLANGEEILCKFVSFQESGFGNFVEVEKGLVLMNGPQGVALGSFFSTGDPDKPVKIQADKIMCLSDINPKLLDQYNNVFNKIKTQPKPSIIT